MKSPYPPPSHHKIDRAHAFFTESIVGSTKYQNHYFNKNSREQTDRTHILKYLDWEQAWIKQVPFGEAVIIPLDYGTPLWTPKKNSALTLDDWTYAMIYEQTGELHAVLVTSIPDSAFLVSVDENTPFSGTVLVEDWYGNVEKAFVHHNGQVYEQSAIHYNMGGRVEEYINCETTDWYSCAGNDAIGWHCQFMYSEQVCTLEGGGSSSGGGLTDDSGFSPGGGGSASDGSDLSGPTDDPNKPDEKDFLCRPGHIKDESGSCINEADLWEEEKIDDSQLKPCMQSIMNDLKNLTQGVGQIVAKFAGNTPGYNWEVKDGALPQGSNAVTSTNYNSATHTVTTTFDASKFGRATDLSLARTILHESIHAHIVTIAKGGLTNEEQNHAYGDNWIIVFERQNHPFIATEFVSGIALSLKQYGTSRGYNLPWQFYNDLAWGGLTHYDPDGDKQFELTPWFKEAFPKSSDRNRILNVINDEQEGKNGKKGSDAGC